MGGAETGANVIGERKEKKKNPQISAVIKRIYGIMASDFLVLSSPLFQSKVSDFRALSFALRLLFFRSLSSAFTNLQPSFFRYKKKAGFSVFTYILEEARGVHLVGAFLSQTKKLPPATQFAASFCPDRVVIIATNDYRLKIRKLSALRFFFLSFLPKRMRSMSRQRERRGWMSRRQETIRPTTFKEAQTESW